MRPNVVVLEWMNFSEKVMKETHVLQAEDGNLILGLEGGMPRSGFRLRWKQLEATYLMNDAGQRRILAFEARFDAVATRRTRLLTLSHLELVRSTKDMTPEGLGRDGHLDAPPLAVVAASTTLGVASTLQPLPLATDDDDGIGTGRTGPVGRGARQRSGAAGGLKQRRVVELGSGVGKDASREGRQVHVEDGFSFPMNMGRFPPHYVPSTTSTFSRLQGTSLSVPLRGGWRDGPAVRIEHGKAKTKKKENLDDPCR